MYKKKPVIVFEGIEGSGKSYHIKRVASFLKKNKLKYVKFREPGGNLNAEKIRKLILDGKSTFNENTDLLLYLAARSENISSIKKSFKNKIILIDRFTDSTIAYQHYGLGIDINIIKEINKFILKNFKIDFTFLNTVNMKNMKSRLKKRKSLNRYDSFSTNFYNKVQNGFLKLAKKNKRKYQIIDSNLNIKENESLIIDRIKKII